MPLKNPKISPVKKNKGENIKKDENSYSDPSASLEFAHDESIDSKKEFFRLMAEKINDDSSGLFDNKVSSSANYSQSGAKISQYRKMFFRFSFMTLVLLLAVLYLFCVKLNLIVYTDRQSVEDSLNFYAYSNEGQVNLDRSVKATINKIELEVGEKFTATGEKNLGGEIVGKVKIINQYSKNQPLVATTRLVTSDDKLFRVKNTVNVPAGGSVEVEVYTDNPSAEMAILPTKFVIPGLWAGLQDKIYAESYEPFEFKKDVKKFITQDDVNRAVNYLNDEIIKQAETRFKNSNGATKNIFSIDSQNSKMELSNEVGDESEYFELKIKKVVNVISLNNDDVVNLVKKKLNILDLDQKVSDVDPDSLTYSLITFNSAGEVAEIKANFLFKTLAGGSENIINKKHLVNLSQDQIKAYLDSVKGLKSYELQFRPSFIKRGPMLVDRINIQYK